LVIFPSTTPTGLADKLKDISTSEQNRDTKMWTIEAVMAGMSLDLTVEEQCKKFDTVKESLKPMKGWAIEELVEGDWDDYVKLFTTVFELGLSLELTNLLKLHELYHHQTGINRIYWRYVGKLDGKIAACGSYMISELNGHRYATIFEICTYKDYRRKGFASRIMTHLIEEARLKGVTRFVLQASKYGEPVYQRMGFIVDDRIHELIRTFTVPH